MASDLPQASRREVWLWLTGRRKRVRVTGNSMLPLFKPEEELLVDLQAYVNRSPQIGDIVLTTHPDQPDLKIIKRVSAILQNGQIEMSGDNPAASTDSREWGPFEPHQILGKATARFG